MSRSVYVHVSLCTCRCVREYMWGGERERIYSCIISFSAVIRKQSISLFPVHPSQPTDLCRIFLLLSGVDLDTNSEYESIELKEKRPPVSQSPSYPSNILCTPQRVNQSPEVRPDHRGWSAAEERMSSAPISKSKQLGIWQCISRRRGKPSLPAADDLATWSMRLGHLPTSSF